MNFHVKLVIVLQNTFIAKLKKALPDPCIADKFIWCTWMSKFNIVHEAIYCYCFSNSSYCCSSNSSNSSSSSCSTNSSHRNGSSSVSLPVF